MSEIIQKEDLDWAEIAVDKAIIKYVASRKEKIPGFEKKTFFVSGSIGMDQVIFKPLSCWGLTPIHWGWLIIAVISYIEGFSIRCGAATAA